MRPTIVLFCFAILLMGCGPVSSPPDSGIYGQVLLGPTCPVERPGLACADKAYQATLTVLTPSGKRVARFTTNPEGSFRVQLPPGIYTLHPETPEGQMLPIGRDQDFIVDAGKFTQLTVSYDSGIR
jgi:hypothetical protein